MSKFVKISTVEIRTNRQKAIKVNINKYSKTGTKQVFFTPEYNGKRLTRTMFSRKYDAVSLAKSFISYKEKL